MILAPNDLGYMDWNSAKTACAKLVLNGYSDWRLPTKEELNQIYQNKDKIGGFVNYNYWSSSEFNNYNAWVQYVSSGRLYNDYKSRSYYVRAGRSF